MIIALQKRNGAFHPLTQEDQEKARDFPDNQILKGNITGTRKERSIRQLGMFWACCRAVAENTEDPNWNDKDKVAIQVKLALNFYKSVVVAPDGTVHFELDSISFKNLRQVEANKIFDRAWPILAGKIGVTVDELLSNSERNYA